MGNWLGNWCGAPWAEPWAEALLVASNCIDFGDLTYDGKIKDGCIKRRKIDLGVAVPGTAFGMGSVPSTPAKRLDKLWHRWRKQPWRVRYRKVARAPS